jgi:tetratricopeptide (TPR) repeat protein
MAFVGRIVRQVCTLLLLIGGLSPSLVHAEDLTALAKQTLQQYQAGRYAEAEQLGKQALNLCERRFGQNRPDCAWAFGNLAIVYAAQGRYADAITLFQRVVSMNEKTLGPEHPDLAQTLNNLAAVYETQGRYADAMSLSQRALAIREKALGPDHPDVADSLNNLAVLYVDLGRYAEAIPLYQRALAIEEKALGPDHPNTATTLNNLAVVYTNQARYDDAIPLYERALAIREKTLGSDHPDVAQSLNNLAIVYARQARFADASSLFKRAIAIVEKALGPQPPDLAPTLNNLAAVYEEQGRHVDAIALYERALAISEKALGPDHPLVAISLSNLADVYSKDARYTDAIRLYQRAAAIDEKVLGPDCPEVARTLSNLAVTYATQERYADAIQLHERALAIFEKALGPDHPDVATSLNNLSIVHLRLARFDDALSFSRRATTILVNRAEEVDSADTDPAGKHNPFKILVQAAFGAAAQHPAQRTALANEAFVAAQRAKESSAAAALAQMAARFATGDSALSITVREQQDLVQQWRALDKAIIAAASKPAEQRDKTAEIELWRQKADVENRLASIATKLSSDFPDYAALADPKPLSVADTQSLLGPNEALILYLVDEKESYVWTMTREGLAWERIDLGASELEEKVAKLREALDPQKVMRALADRKEPKDVLFDSGLAYELYSALMGPVEGTIKDKKHILVVPTGALTSLPLHVLVTAKSEMLATQPSDFRNVAWLAKRQAVTVLPSVASLRALRVLAKAGAGSKPLTGYADPVFKQGETQADE